MDTEREYLQQVNVFVIDKENNDFISKNYIMKVGDAKTITFEPQKESGSIIWVDLQNKGENGKIKIYNPQIISANLNGYKLEVKALEKGVSYIKVTPKNYPSLLIRIQVED